ncbi:MAG: PepSY-associated TM helix domain-containing protein [Pseudomonadota bacterium]
MISLSQSKTKRLVAIHGWSGTVLGLLLYVVIFTGAVAVFEREISVWSQGGTQYSEGIGRKIDRLFRQHAKEIDRKYYEEIFIARNRSGDFRFSFQTHEKNPATDTLEDKAVILTIDEETEQVVSRWEGFLSERAPDRGDTLSRFFVDIHVQLHLPNPYGLILVGILGLMMMAAAISGILIHRHLIKEMFLPVRPRKSMVSARDLHNLAGTWGIPFAILLAFTGVFFSFATTLGVPIMAMVAFGGDQQALIESVQGTAKVLDKTPASLASLDYIIKDAINRTEGAYVTFIGIQHYDTMAATVRVNMATIDGQLSGNVFGYEGVSREFTGEKPLLGQVPSLGSSLIGIIAPLHFGSFAGIASKTVWLGLGLAMAFVSATGMLLWTKRREDQAIWREFHKWIYVVIWGLPVAMMVSAYAFFLTLPAGDPGWWVPASFVIASLVIIGACLMKPFQEDAFRRLTGIMAVGLPLLRHLTGGTSWSESILTQGQGVIIAIDVVLLALGLILLCWKQIKQSSRTMSAQPEPAE